MAKRAATSQLNHDNWDTEEKKEEPGTFVAASEEKLQNRIIRKAKRSLGNHESGGISPFAAFSGFSPSTTSKPFSFLKKDTNETEGNSALATDIKSVEKKENGTAETNQIKERDEQKVDSKKSSSSSIVSNKEKSVRSIEYYRRLQSLNESVLNWMQLHLAKNSCCDFTPVFNDYKKHLDMLNVTYPVKNKESCSSTESKGDEIFKKPASPLKSQHGLSLSQTANSSSNAKVHSSFKLENSLKHEDETDYGAHFSSNTTNTSTFSFGIKSSPTATSASSFGGPTTSLKEEDSTDEKKNSFKFSFGFKNPQTDQSKSDKPFSFSVTHADKSSDTAVSEESEYIPPKNEFTAVAEKDALYSKRCKLFFKKGEEYTEKGVGILYLKPVDDKTQLLIRADTNLGNILLNILLSASIPMSRTGKNNVLLVCIPNPPIDVKNPDSKEAIPILIRVKTSEDADELLEKLNLHKS